MNRIGEILKEKGINEITPSDDILSEMGIKIHTWNKIVTNKKDPQFFQAPIIAKMLNVEIEDLFPKGIKENVKAKHGLIYQ